MFDAYVIGAMKYLRSQRSDAVKYAVIVRHLFRDSDYRIEIIDVPREIHNVGPFEVKKLIQDQMLGPFEIVKVTDRINTREWPTKESGE
jgi:hypothetical protein